MPTSPPTHSSIPELTAQKTSNGYKSCTYMRINILTCTHHSCIPELAEQKSPERIQWPCASMHAAPHLLL